MAIVLAVPKLFDDVVARFALDAAMQVPPTMPVPNVFGWREPARRGVSLRVVWVPGNDANGDLGELGAARNPGRNPRPLATLDELVTVYLEAFSGATAAIAENERAQYQAARELFNAWWRAVYLAARGTVALVSANWVIDKNERRFGATIRALVSVQAPVLDKPSTIAPVDARAEIDLSELDVTETMRSGPVALVATTAAIALTGLQTVDGEPLAAGDRVLVKNQAAAETNGIYVVALGAWARADDFNEAVEVLPGLLVFVAAGAENGGADFVLTTLGPIVVGTTPLVFARMPTEES